MFDARTDKFEVVTLFGKKVLFCCGRIDKSTVPEDLYIYSVRHDDDMQGNPVQLANWILVNHLGDIISKEPFELEENKIGTNAYKDINPEADWNYEGYEMTLKEYLEEE